MKRNSTRNRPKGQYRRYVHKSEGKEIDCPECGGTGQIEVPEYKGECFHCDGTGRVVQVGRVTLSGDAEGVRILKNILEHGTVD